MSMSNTSIAYLSPSCIAVSLGLVTILIIPSGQYLAQLAQPVHRLSYQENSSPRKRGCWSCLLSGTDTRPIMAFIVSPGRDRANASGFLPSIRASPIGPILRSGYW